MAPADWAVVAAAFFIGALVTGVVGSIKGWMWPGLAVVWYVACITILIIGMLAVDLSPQP
jgi:uncharacterized membrane protein YjjB (DUF3815 family)